jgi:spore coat polysaccharide biosynthesis protein SpsF
MTTLGIVHVPRQSGGVETKIARKLGGTSLLEWVIRRISDCQQLSGVMVVAGDPAADDALDQLVPPDVPRFSGPQTDALARFVAAADQCGARSIVRVCAHAPFVDPVLVDRLVVAADKAQCDYLGYCRGDGRPAMHSQVGLVAEWCSCEALGEADRRMARSPRRDHPAACLLSHPEKFRVRLMPLPASLDRDDVRLRVELEEDWEHAQVIYDALAHDEWDWQRVARLLDHQPALRKRMAALNRASESK